MGWKADASYYYGVRSFIRGDADLYTLEKSLKIGDLGKEYCLKSPLAFERLVELKDEAIEVDWDNYHEIYSKRDEEARRMMRELIDLAESREVVLFSNLIL